MVNQLCRVVLVLLLTTASVWAQDAAQQVMLLNQQTQQLQSAQQANDATQTALQQSSAQNALIAQNALDDTLVIVPPPHLSVKSGSYSGPVTVSIKDRFRNAKIFYTTDGWTPTPLSKLYTGPIRIDGTTTLKAVAFVQGAGRSATKSAKYSLPLSVAGKQPDVAPDGSLQVLFTAAVDSRQIHAGDTVPLVIAEDAKVHDITIPRGTPVKATVTRVDPQRWSGIPASISFTVESVTSAGRTIPLVGGATKDGPEKAGGRGGLFSRGNPAEIEQGAELTVHAASS